MIKIVEIPNEYMNKGLISNYPPHQKTTNIESKFFDYVTKNNSIETIIAISEFIECKINLNTAKLISEKFNKNNVRNLIKNNDQKLKN